MYLYALTHILDKEMPAAQDGYHGNSTCDQGDPINLTSRPDTSRPPAERHPYEAGGDDMIAGA